MARSRLLLALPVLLGPIALTFAKGGYFDVPRLTAGALARAARPCRAAGLDRPLAALDPDRGPGERRPPAPAALSRVLHRRARAAAPARGAPARRARAARRDRRRRALRPVRAPAAEP